MRRKQLEDLRSSEELLEAHRLEREDENSDWDALWLLRDRGSRYEFEMGHRLTKSRDSRDREIGADLLAQLGSGSGVFQDEVVSILIHLLNDPNPRVIAAAAIGLGHRQDARAIAPLVVLSQHPDVQVRYAVAFGLLGHEEDPAISTLIQLSGDSDLATRNWATFGLGSQIDTDTPAIRDALSTRLDDPDSEVRGEALVGLAYRQDPRALAALPGELEREDVGILALKAAERLADQALLPHLEKLLARLTPEDNDLFRQQLLKAIVACQASE